MSEVRAISFVYCPGCFGGRKMRVRFSNGSVIEVKNELNYVGYDLRYVEGNLLNDTEIRTSQIISASSIVSSWMRGNALFPGVDLL
jgi:hypothetical protein